MHRAYKNKLGLVEGKLNNRVSEHKVSKVARPIQE